MTKIRKFKTGATRNIDNDKLDYDGFLSFEVLEAFAKYMHRHRFQADGTIRDSDNWKKGIPKDAYMKSMFRHFMDVWELHHTGGTKQNPEGETIDIIDALTALMFNVQGMLYEILKEKKR